MKQIIFIVTCVLCAIDGGAFADSVQARPLTIVGRSDATVTTPYFSLGDIAAITSSRIIDDEAVIGLKKIRIDASPAPGKTSALPAMTVIEKLRDAGVDLNNVGYTFPRMIVVRRASRALGLDEIKGAIDSFVRLSKQDVEVKDITLPQDLQVAPGDLTLSAIAARPSTTGQMTYSLEAKINGENPRHFDVNASVNEWRDVPIAKRALGKGELIRTDDLTRARLNISALPRDALLVDEQVVGLEVHSPIGFGEPFRKNSLNIPPLVAKGSRVTMVVKNGILEVTAKGVSLDEGIAGDSIRIQNDSSKKVIVGKIVGEGLVEVLP